MAIMNTPLKLNGYPVVRVEQHTNCATVMMDNGDKIVVATWWPELKTAWSWGHYFHGDTRQADATADFNETATRNRKR